MLTAYKIDRDGSPSLHFLLRYRYQILAGILLAVVLPSLARHLMWGTPFGQMTQYNTAIGAIVAIVLGYLSYRRLNIFPGIASGGYVVTSFSVAFALLATMMFLLRLDYSRVHFTISYILTVAFYTAIHLKVISKRMIVLGYVPGGATVRLPHAPNITWRQLELGKIPAIVDGVVCDLRFDHSDQWDSQIANLVLQGIPVYHVKDAIEQLSGRVEVEHLSENTLGSLNPNDVFFKIKAAADWAVAAVALLACWPVMLVIAVLIRMDSPGPSLFRQERTGFRAKPFTVYKFRTMVTAPQPASNEHDGARIAAMTKPNDPRITRLGAFLRRTRLDELPQLFNIILGQMSLIGPRPEAVPLTKWYEKEIAFYHYRHIIKPGVTGWAQINQGHVADVDDVREKLHLDFYYVKNFSLWLDLLIILRTVQTMITGHGAR